MPRHGGIWYRRMGGAASSNSREMRIFNGLPCAVSFRRHADRKLVFRRWSGKAIAHCNFRM